MVRGVQEVDEGNDKAVIHLLIMELVGYKMLCFRLLMTSSNKLLTTTAYSNLGFPICGSDDEKG